MTSTRYLGNLDAKQEEEFDRFFVESALVRRLLRNTSDIVYSAKGGGKTALCRALAELHSDFFLSTNIIELDKVSFAVLYAKIKQLQRTSDNEPANIAKVVWLHFLALYCLKSFLDNPSSEADLISEVDNFISQEGFDSRNTQEGLLGRIERLLQRMAHLGIEDNLVPGLGLSSRQRTLVDTFPPTPKEGEMLERASGSVVSQGKRRILVCIDGLDTIVDHTMESRTTIFAGLLAAVQTSIANPLFRGFVFKVFLPQELTDTARSLVWDSDKYLYFNHYIRWDRPHMEQIISKRLQPHSRSRSKEFRILWSEIMHEKVYNSVHKFEENSFEYVLRHSLMRPRQVLAHVQKLLDGWDEQSTSFKIDPTFVPGVVAETNFYLADFVVHNLEIAHPGLGGFLKSWGRSTNVMKIGEFRSKMKKRLYLDTEAEVDDMFDAMYNYGLFGLAASEAVRAGDQKSFFRFSFGNHGPIMTVHSTFGEDDFLALSPMFHEYCGCVSSQWGAIVPSDL